MNETLKTILELTAAPAEKLRLLADWADREMCDPYCCRDYLDDVRDFVRAIAGAMEKRE